MSILNQAFTVDSKFDDYLQSALIDESYNIISDIDIKMYFFICQLFDKAIDKNIVAIGITDYFPAALRATGEFTPTFWT